MYHRKMSFGGGYSIVRADREPCIVCGHPTGDCVGQHDAPKRIWGLGDIPSMVEGQTVRVGEDHWEEREVTPGVKTRVRIAKAGDQIPLTKARELGIL